MFKEKIKENFTCLDIEALKDIGKENWACPYFIQKGLL